MILADTLPVWSSWAKVTPVIVSGSASGLVRVPLPAGAIAPDRNGNYPDLRVIDEADRDIPLAIDARAAKSESREVSLIDVGFVPRRGTQAVADLGPAGNLVDTIVILTDTQRLPTYFEHVDLDAADDRATWREIRTGATIYRVAEDNGKGNQTISFPATRSRWLRIRVLDSHRELPLTGAVVARAEPRPSLIPLTLQPTSALDRATHAQTWTYAAPVAVRASAVAFSNALNTYSRAVTVETSNDGTTWDALATGRIEHYADGSEHTTFAFPERTTTHVRVTLENGDDRPLTGIRPELLTLQHDVVFAVAPGQRYRILSGNPNVAAASYDLGARLAHERWSAISARAGATQAYDGFRDMRPIGERYPWLLTLGTSVIAVVLAILAIRTVRKAGAVR